MRRAVLALALAASLGACATTQVAQVKLDTGKAWIATLALVDASSLAAAATVRAGVYSKAQDLALADVADQIAAAIKVGEKAYDLGDNATLAAQTMVLTRLQPQLTPAP